MKVLLPENLNLRCPKCKAVFTIPSKSLDGKLELTCPMCGRNGDSLDFLPTKVKRQVYHALRDEVERDIYQRYIKLNPSSSEWNPDSSEG